MFPYLAIVLSASAKFVANLSNPTDSFGATWSRKHLTTANAQRLEGSRFARWPSSIPWQQAAPGSGPWFVGDPASQKVLQIGQHEFRTDMGDSNSGVALGSRLLDTDRAANR
jgi:hypothetical protein